MRVEGRSTRFHERTKLEVPLEVVYSESADVAWREQTRTEEVTICGGGFTLSRPVEPQRLIHLKMPLPKQFRLFDFSKTEYGVWGLVRYVRLLPMNIADRIRLKVGTALVGHNPPPSYLRDPATLYDLKPVLRSRSLWELRELPRSTGRYTRSFEDRQNVSTAVIIQTLDNHGHILETSAAETQNVSEGGMALVAKLGGKCLGFVLIKNPNNDYSLLAKVCGVYDLGTDNFTRLHLQFISGKWSV